MFRVGDKGVNRGGIPYVVMSVDTDERAHVNDFVVVARIGGVEEHTFTRDGRYYATGSGPNDMDLLSPNRTALELAGMREASKPAGEPLSLKQTFMLAILGGSHLRIALGDCDDTIVMRVAQMAEKLVAASYVA